MRKVEYAKVKTLDKKTQAIRHAYAFYDFDTGTIELGCEEKYTACAIWHETIHSILFEQFFLEANYHWDLIADELQEFLFDCCPPEKTYIQTLPEPKAKIEDDGWYVGRKQREKSVRVGYKYHKQNITKRIPKRVSEEAEAHMTNNYK